MRLLWAVVAVCACGSVSAPGDDGADDEGMEDDGTSPPPDDPSFTLSIVDASASVPLDGERAIEIEVIRAGGFAGPVTLVGVDLPGGVAVVGATVGQDQTSADVVVSGAVPLAIGDSVTFGIEGAGEGVPPRTVTISDAPVTGKPGALDSSFGPNGIASISFDNDDAGAFTAMQVIKGNVVATGYGQGGLGAIGFRTMRFTAEGGLDPTWNGGALVRTNFGGSTGETSAPTAIGQQVDGKLIAIGSTRDPGATDDIGLVRYSVTGGFGGVDFGDGDGTSAVDIGGYEQTSDGVVLADSSIVAVGTLDGHIVISKMTPNGLLDGAFAAPNGFERLVRGSTSRAGATTTDDQGRILLACTITTGGQNDLLLIRLGSDGSLDDGFGSGGEVAVSGPANEQAVAVRAVADAIYLASIASEGNDAFFRVRRYLADGELDASYGTQGVAAYLSTEAEARDMVALADGRVVMLGSAAGQAFFVRFTRRGQVDTRFGPDGTGTNTVFIGESGEPRALEAYSIHQIVFSGGNLGGVPGPGTFGLVGRMWM